MPQPTLAPVPLSALAGLPIAFLDYVQSGDWHIHALDFDSDNVHALAMWIDNPTGEDYPLFIVDTSFLNGNETIRVALRVLVNRALDAEAERITYMRLPVAA